MAVGKKTGGKNFEPGKTGNPNGRPKVPEDVKQARQMTRDEFTRILNAYMAFTRNELDLAMQDEKTPAMNAMIASIIIKAADSGDHYRLNFLLDRMIGKVKDEISIEMPRPMIVTFNGAKLFHMGAITDYKEGEEG